MTSCRLQQTRARLWSPPYEKIFCTDFELQIHGRDKNKKNRSGFFYTKLLVFGLIRSHFVESGNWTVETREKRKQNKKKIFKPCISMFFTFSVMGNCLGDRSGEYPDRAGLSSSLGNDSATDKWRKVLLADGDGGEASATTMADPGHKLLLLKTSAQHRFPPLTSLICTPSPSPATANG